jgi:hypothetical protein
MRQEGTHPRNDGEDVMPTVSDKQERFMQAVAHNPKFAKKVGVPQSVGKEFTKAEGGQMKESKAMMKKEVGFMKAKGAPKSMIKHEEAEMKAMKRGGKAYAAGGLAAGHKAADGIAKKGKTRGMEVTMKGSTGMKAGGKVKKMNYGGKC